MNYEMNQFEDLIMKQFENYATRGLLRSLFFDRIDRINRI